MKPRKIKDTFGDTAAVSVAGPDVVVVNAAPSMAYTPAQSKDLRKALKRAEREISSYS